MGKKSAAQLKRLIARAASRGEVYVPPSEPDKVKAEDQTGESESAAIDARSSAPAATLTPANTESDKDTVKLKAALVLKKDLNDIEENADLKAKERRSAKRKAEAIALESSGYSTVESLLEWYETTGKHLKQQRDDASPKESVSRKETETTKRSNPYIVFVGQLAFDTTKEQLFQHLKQQLKDDFAVTEHNVKIRMLQDAKTNKSRGMAFVEIKDDPEHLYALLKLHHTFLGGRRINVERSAGGGSDTRKSKIKLFREEQLHHMDATVNAMLEEYYQRGEIQRQGEIDEGVILLCKRHSATVVQAALERYVESNGRDMDNPSAYLTFLLGKLAEEGIYNDRDKEVAAKGRTKSAKPVAGKEGSRASPRFAKTKRPGESNEPNKRPRLARDSTRKTEFTKQGVDMSISDRSGDLRDIFPWLNRGRGRGRGYM
jgi:RNA recognition motif-containing protein